MASTTFDQGASGEVQGTESTTLFAANTNTRYRITGFSIDYNDNTAYFYSTTGTSTFQIIAGSTTIDIGSYGIANGSRPAISWTGNVLCAPNTAIVYKVTRNSTNQCGIRNLYHITITYDQLTRPTVSAGAKVTKTQMDSLRTWKGGSGTEVSQNATITATVGNTYKSGLTAGSTQLDDNWYNTVS